MDCENWIKAELIPELIKNDKFSVPWKNEPTKLVNCDINSLSLADNFMTTKCYRVKVKLSNSTGEQFEEIGIFVKTSRPWVTRNRSPNEIFFKNEIAAYAHLFPAIGWTEYLPKCYYYHVKSENDCVIAFEDFTLKGYNTAKAKGRLSLAHIYEAVQVIGKFHGLSYALKHSNPAKFNQIKEMFAEGKYYEGIDYNEPWHTTLQNAPKRAVESVKEHNHKYNIPEDFLNELREVIGFPLHYEYKTFASHREPYAIFSHGDYLRNNIAFKFSEFYEENEEVPIHAIMFDFQTIRYTSPMTDLAILLAMSTSVDVKSKHFDYIFSTYHNALVTAYCEKLSVEVENIPEFLRYNSMLKEYVRLMPLGLSNTYFLPITLDGVDVQIQHDPDTAAMEYKRGGELVNRELRAIVRDIYEFNQKFEMKLEHL